MEAMVVGSGFVLWITGLSGAGKTTVSSEVVRRILTECSVKPILVDGDMVRKVFGDKFGYSAEDRRYLAGCYSRLCQELSLQGHVVVCATISMFHDVRGWNRENIKNYFEVYLRVPVEELAARDNKGLYAKSLTNIEVVGRDITPELPSHPDLMIDNYGEMSGQKAASIILEALGQKGSIKCQK